jgi:hypothetical protein
MAAAIHQAADFEFEAPSRYGPNRPLYNPENWDKDPAARQIRH